MDSVVPTAWVRGNAGQSRTKSVLKPEAVRPQPVVLCQPALRAERVKVRGSPPPKGKGFVRCRVRDDRLWANGGGDWFLHDTMAASSPSFTVFIDFDGTLVEPNVAIIVVERFAKDGPRLAREVDRRLKAEELTLREAWEEEAAALPANRLDEMVEFVRENAPLRSGAREFLDLLRQHHVPTTILSGGLDSFIRPVLEREGLDLPVLSEEANQGPGGNLRVVHPHGHPTCRLCGICKAAAVTKVDGSRGVFIGDGSTDRYGAEVADIVFARHRLLEYCRKTDIPCFPFEDFGPVTARMSAWLEGREPVPPPRATGREASRCPISQELARSRK